MQYDLGRKKQITSFVEGEWGMDNNFFYHRQTVNFYTFLFVFLFWVGKVGNLEGSGMYCFALAFFSSIDDEVSFEWTDEFGSVICFNPYHLYHLTMLWSKTQGVFFMLVLVGFVVEASKYWLAVFLM